MIDILPPELVSRVYEHIPLSCVRTVTLQLSRAHRTYSIARILAAVAGLHLTLVPDSRAPAFTHTTYQHNARCSLVRAPRSPADSAAAFLRFIPASSHNHSCPPVHIITRCSVRRIKAIFFEDYYNGGQSWPDNSQMGVMLMASDVDEREDLFNVNEDDDDLDELTKRLDGLDVSFMDSKSLLETAGARIYAPDENSITQFGRVASISNGIVRDIETSVTSIGNHQVDHIIPKVVSAYLKWDALIVSKSEPETVLSLTSVSVPVSAILDGFLKYSPGLTDLDTEDYDSEWEDEE
ncbi:hypothetical protein HDU82_002625, partial [Entophlyctis luteolus]